MAVEISEMTVADYDEVMALWQSTEGMGLSSADSREGIAAFLARNPGLSLVARQHGRVIAAVLCGHDGRRGYLHHLAVARHARGQGLGRKLVDAGLAKLEAAGIQKCHIFLHIDNEKGEQFWRKIGWKERLDLKIMSRDIG
jgi:putative acetyltransferase